MLSGYSTKSEILAALSVTEALIVALRRKGILTDQEIDSLLSDVESTMSANALAEVQGAADVVKSMKQEALS
ncbi:MAG: hypothetical protein AAF495_22980 [Pseudomonadota bacterium]